MVSMKRVAFSWLAWVVGTTLACALLWHLMGKFMLVDYNNTLSMIDWRKPIVWIAPGSMGLLFGSMMWSVTTPYAKPTVKKAWPSALAKAYKFRFLIAWLALSSFMIAISGFAPGSFIGAPLASAFIIAFGWSFTSMRADNQKTAVKGLSRLDLANRMDKAIDAYIKTLPPIAQRARDKELPFLQTIHSLNSMIIKQGGGWPVNYAEYADGSFRVCRLMIEHLKPNLFREDIVHALLDASDCLTERTSSFDIDAAETAVVKVEVLLGVYVD